MQPLIKTLTGPELFPYRDAVADLRIRVFRDFPYLYDGNPAYETRYLQRYLDCPECLFVIVLDEDQVVGASTGLPMENETREFSKPFNEQNEAITEIFYFGESVLLPAYRGRGIGHVFFDQREAFARRLGRFKLTTFCAVNRSADHPLRPADYRTLDAFWVKRGYTRQARLTTHFSWKDVNESKESEKSMTFWTRSLEAG